jgi:hypothetical protein
MKSSYLILLVFSILLSFSCNDACDLVDCGQNGICNDGTCECDPGYGGKFCENQNCAPDFFEGTYQGILNCNNSKTFDYNLTLKKISETIVNMEFDDGKSIDFDLNLFTCSANTLDSGFFYSWDYTITYISEGAIQLRVVTSVTQGEDCDCKGTLVSK